MTESVTKGPNHALILSAPFTYVMTNGGQISDCSWRHNALIKNGVRPRLLTMKKSSSQGGGLVHTYGGGRDRGDLELTSVSHWLHRSPAHLKVKAFQHERQQALMETNKNGSSGHIESGRRPNSVLIRRQANGRTASTATEGRGF